MMFGTSRQILFSQVEADDDFGGNIILDVLNNDVITDGGVYDVKQVSMFSLSFSYQQ